MRKSDGIPMLASVVAAVGAPDFPAHFLAALSAFCGARLFSAFSYGTQDAPRALFAEGDCAGVPDFAQTASLAYTRRYWRNDRAGRWAAASRRSDGVAVIRTHAADIADSDYRCACYERGGIAERLSLVSMGARNLMANGYRAARDGAFQPAEIAQVEHYAPILMAALARHVDLSERRLCDGTPVSATRLLLAADAGLSVREAEVAAALILGRTQREISAESGLSLSSVITYRRRAYCKLGVMDKQELMAAYRDLSQSALLHRIDEA